MNQEVINEFVKWAHGDLKKVQEMAAEHPEVLNASASWNETALGAACHTARKEIVSWLLEQGVPSDIFAAVILGRMEQVRAHLESEPALIHARGAHGIPILYYPVIVGDIECSELLLARGTDVNAGAGGNTALHGAAWYDQSEMAAWLISKGADVNVKDYQGLTPLAVALQNGKDAVVDVLRKNGGQQ